VPVRAPEARLLARCIKGEEEAWREFLKLYSGLLYRAISNICAKANPPVSQDTIEDLCQSCLLSLIEDNFRKLRQYRKRRNASFRTWLSVVAANHARDFLRKCDREIKHLVSVHPRQGEGGKDGRDPMEAIPASGVSQLEALKLKEIMEFLQNCIWGLSPADRLLLELMREDKLNDQEIARVMGTTVQAVQMRKSRLRKSLAEKARERGLLER